MPRGYKNTDLTRIPEELEIPTGSGTRLLVRTHENTYGARFVTVAPQYLDKSGQYRLSHSGLILSPDVARHLAPALLSMAATIDGTPTDPTPSAEDRRASRWP